MSAGASSFRRRDDGGGAAHLIEFRFGGGDRSLGARERSDFVRRWNRDSALVSPGNRWEHTDQRVNDARDPPNSTHRAASTATATAHLYPTGGTPHYR